MYVHSTNKKISKYGNDWTSTMNRSGMKVLL